MTLNQSRVSTMFDGYDGDQPKKQLETARGGSGGRRRTAVGSGDGGDWDDYKKDWSGDGEWADEEWSEQKEQPPTRYAKNCAVICDRDNQLRAGFNCIFRTIVPVMGLAENMERAWKLILQYNPTLVICSAGPGVFELCRKIRDERFDRRVSVLILTDTFGATRYFNRLISSGVTGVVLKSSSEEELRDAARVVMNGGLYCDSHLTSLLARRPITRVNGVNLSPVEANVLVRLNLSDAEITRELTLSDEILSRILKRVFNALKVESRIEAQTRATEVLGKLGLIQLPQLVAIDLSTGECVEQKQARENCLRAIAESLSLQE